MEYCNDLNFEGTEAVYNCEYHICRRGPIPFLLYRMELNEGKLDFYKRSDKRSDYEKCNDKRSDCDKRIDCLEKQYKGIFANKYAFYETDRIEPDMYTMDELVNYYEVGFFMKNQQFLFLRDDSGRPYEIPTTAYLGVESHLLNYTMTFGARSDAVFHVDDKLHTHKVKFAMFNDKRRIPINFTPLV
jgi:hypothetical protein